MAKRKTSGALAWIVKEAKRLRREYPNRYNHLQNPWRDGYIAQASAIYATKHGGKSPVGHKKHKSLKMTGFKNIEEKEYIVNTKNGNTFHVKAYNLKEAKKYASFNARHQKDSVERAFLNKNKIRGITTKSKSHTDKNRITANIQVGSTAQRNSDVLKHLNDETFKLSQAEIRLRTMQRDLPGMSKAGKAFLRRSIN